MSQSPRNRGLLERLFEGLLWNSRLVVLVPVVASLLVGVAMVGVATADVYHLASDMARYIAKGDHHDEPAPAAAQHTIAEHAAPDIHAPREAHIAAADSRPGIIARIVEIIDGYLLATIMLIFAFGLYELFISRIDAAEDSEFANRVLLIRSFDDLKDRLAKVVFLVLVVKFFEHALRMEFASSLELLYLALGIALIAVGIVLTTKKAGYGKAGAGEH